MKETQNYKYTCIALSMYALLQYLLLQSEEDAKYNTFYFFGPVIPKSIGAKLLSNYPFNWTGEHQKSITRSIKKIRLRVLKYKLFPFLKSCQIFAQDHGAPVLLIGSRPYSLLADGPLFLTNHASMNSSTTILLKHQRNSLMGIITTALFGRNLYNQYGNNRQCTDIFLSEENCSHVLEGKRVHIESLQSLWSRASESKRGFISNVFDVSCDDLALLRSRSTIFFSQPFVDDGVLTEVEYIELLKRIFQHFPQKDMLIKTHPRDNFNFEKHFPEIEVFKKPLNIQLLLLYGISFCKAVTICSTSVQNLPEETEVIWFGPCIHPKIESCFGKNYSISRPYTTISL